MTAAIVRTALADPLVAGARDARRKLGKLVDLHVNACLRKADEPGRAGRYAEAVAVCRDAARDPLFEGFERERRKLLDRCAAYRLREGNDAIDRKDWEAAIDVFRMGLAERPRDRKLRQNLRYSYQQWVAEVEAGGDEAALRRVLDLAIRDDPGERRWVKLREQLDAPDR